MNKTLVILLGCMCAVWCGCGLSPLTGGSSQQGNGVVSGYVLSADGSPVKDASVRIRRVTYVKTHGGSVESAGVYDAVTDNSGFFMVRGVDTGRYTMEANDGISAAAMKRIVLETGQSTIDIGKMRIKPYARIVGSLPDFENKSGASFYVQIRGLERLSQIGTDGTFAIVDLPEGNFDVRIVGKDSALTPIEVSGIEAKSEATASVIVQSGWRYARKIYLNTSPSGADVSATLTGFPVLIRLNESNFDFTQARPDGADIRFVRSAAEFLPCEIERWDVAESLAEIWVKVDTIFGNDGIQSLTMYWGNSGAAVQYFTKEVFDTALGFTGVWHLGEDGDSVYDATYNHHHGSDSGCATEAGVIGKCRKFSGGSFAVIPGLLNAPLDVTLSAWVRVDSSKGGQDIVSIGDAVLIRMDDILGMGTSGCYHNTPVVSDTSYVRVTSGKYLAKTGWHHVAFSINSTTNTQTLYIDGEQCAVANNINPINYAGLGTNTYIGKHGNGKSFFFYGLLDEVRVYRIAKSHEWIRLCVANQKEDGKLIRFARSME